jgi:hypothetical protein
MQKLNEYADRVVLLLLVLAVAVLGLYVSKLNGKVTELANPSPTPVAEQSVSPSVTASPSASVAPTKVLLKAAPVVSKAVVK